MFGQHFLHASQIICVVIAIVRSKGARERGAKLEIVQIEKLFTRQFNSVIFALRPLVKLTSDRVNAVVDTFAVMGDHPSSIEESGHVMHHHIFPGLPLNRVVAATPSPAQPSTGCAM